MAAGNGLRSRVSADAFCERWDTKTWEWVDERSPEEQIFLSDCDSSIEKCINNARVGE